MSDVAELEVNAHTKYEVDNLLQRHKCELCVRKGDMIKCDVSAYWTLMTDERLYPELIPLLYYLLTNTTICYYTYRHLTSDHNPTCNQSGCVASGCRLIKFKRILLLEYMQQILQSQPNVTAMQKIIDCDDPATGAVVKLKLPIKFSGESDSKAYVECVQMLLRHNYRVEFEFIYLNAIAKVNGFKIDQLLAVLMDHNRLQWLQRYDFFVLYKLHGLDIEPLLAEARLYGANHLFHFAESPSRTLFLLTDVKSRELVELLEKWWSKPHSNLKSFYKQNLKLNRSITKPLYMSSLENVYDRLAAQAVNDGEYEIVAKYRQHYIAKTQNKTNPPAVKITLPSQLDKASSKHRLKVCLVHLVNIVSRGEIILSWTSCGFDASEIDYFYDKSKSHDEIVKLCAHECVDVSACHSISEWWKRIRNKH
ncbi:ORF-48 [Agrotis segetum nucleopolyhedrovirus A]|uniref:ORF-48 n=1 Tax=Agrotis segetum nuclear polyhedrosis virus TaxID=1962501 RepID=Q287M4_NPVAS|nr:ORF-48 [Agrotis segetum nucleopolyhedrovirus A]AAZ38214.1 ORF-48 [Agrotis segetum nucleopolyhedrovirus A]